MEKLNIHTVVSTVFLPLSHLLMSDLYSQRPKAYGGPKTELYCQISHYFFLLSFFKVIVGQTLLTILISANVGFLSFWEQRRSGRPYECIRGSRIPTGSSHKHESTLKQIAFI